MPVENISPATGITVPSITSTATGDVIKASHFTEMISVLENLVNHSHIFYDDYTTVCECQCQCACNRGIL